jgi:hypothetical protein
MSSNRRSRVIMRRNLARTFGALAREFPAHRNREFFRPNRELNRRNREFGPPNRERRKAGSPPAKFGTASAAGPKLDVARWRIAAILRRPPTSPSLQGSSCRTLRAPEHSPRTYKFSEAHRADDRDRCPLGSPIRGLAGRGGGGRVSRLADSAHPSLARPRRVDPNPT